MVGVSYASRWLAARNLLFDMGALLRAVLVLGWVPFVAGIDHGLTPWLVVNAVLLTPTVMVVLAGHEAAHALVGRAVGMRTSRILLGHGRVVREFRALGCPIEVRALPLWGITILATEHQSWLRLRLWLAILAGPTFNLLLALAARWVAGWGGADPDSSSPIAAGLAPWMLLYLANLYGLLGSALPLRLQTAMGELRTDAWQLLALPFYRPSILADLRVSADLAQAYEHGRAGRDHEALRCYQRAIARAPESYTARLNQAVTLIRLGALEQARSEMLALLAVEPPAAYYRYVLLNNVAWVDAVIDQPDLRAEAENFSRQALAHGRKVGAFLGTRGFVLVRQGKLEAGLSLIRRAFHVNSDPHGRALNACCLAIGLLRQGKREEAGAYADEASRLDPKCPLLPEARSRAPRPSAGGQLSTSAGE